MSERLIRAWTDCRDEVALLAYLRDATRHADPVLTKNPELKDHIWTAIFAGDMTFLSALIRYAGVVPDEDTAHFIQQTLNAMEALFTQNGHKTWTMSQLLLRKTRYTSTPLRMLVPVQAPTLWSERRIRAFLEPLLMRLVDAFEQVCPDTDLMTEIGLGYIAMLAASPQEEESHLQRLRKLVQRAQNLVANRVPKRNQAYSRGVTARFTSTYDLQDARMVVRAFKLATKENFFDRFTSIVECARRVLGRHGQQIDDSRIGADFALYMLGVDEGLVTKKKGTCQRLSGFEETASPTTT